MSFFIVDSTLSCYNYNNVRGRGEYSRALTINALIQAALVLISNPIHVVRVLRSFSQQQIGKQGSEGKQIFFKVALLGILFEITYTIRVALILKQEYWKEHNKPLYNFFFSVYIIIGEICCQMVLIFAIGLYTHKLRKKYLRSNKNQGLQATGDELLSTSNGQSPVFSDCNLSQTDSTA